jgi:hypothetical protein
MMKPLLIVCMSLLLQACSTIYFQSDMKSSATTYSEWHHDWLYGLIEGSDPVDLSARCKGADWRTVKTEETFLQGFVAGLASNLYTPHNVEYSCVKAKK